MQTLDAAEGLHKIRENTPKMLQENICSTNFFISVEWKYLLSGLTRQPLRDSSGDENDKLTSSDGEEKRKEKKSLISVCTQPNVSELSHCGKLTDILI